MMTAVLDTLSGTVFTLWGSPVSWAEVLAFGLSIWMVERNMRVHPAGWPLAILASLLYLLVFARSGLYGEAALQLMFVAVSLWGWWTWLHAIDRDGSRLRVRRLGRRGTWLVLSATLVAWPLVGWALDRWTDSTVPYSDALLTSASVTGQWLLGRKHVETWPVWLAVNLGSVALFLHKSLWLTDLLYAIFALLSVLGWRAWRRAASLASVTT